MDEHRMHEHDEQHDVGWEDAGWSRWDRPDRPPAEMDRDELLAELQRVRHELATYRTEVRQQMDQLAESRRELEASRDRYADLYDMAPVGYVTLDPNGLIADINLIGAEVLGVERKRLINRPFMGWIVQPARRDLLDPEAGPQSGDAVTLSSITVENEGGTLFASYNGTRVAVGGKETYN